MLIQSNLYQMSNWKKYLTVGLTPLFVACGGGDDVQEMSDSAESIETVKVNAEDMTAKQRYDKSISDLQEKYKTSEDEPITEYGEMAEISFSTTGFIDKDFDTAIDALANDMMDGIMVMIKLEGWKKGGTSFGFAINNQETGTYQTENAPMQKASFSSNEFMFGSESGTVTITSISDDFVEGTVSDIVLTEESTFGAEPITINGSFKVPRIGK